MKSAAQFLPSFATLRPHRPPVRRTDPMAGSPEVEQKIQALQKLYAHRIENISFYRSGGRSLILRGDDLQRRSRVALKCPIDMLGREHLLLEAQALQSIQCDTVIACHENNCYVSPPHLILEYFEGSSLEDLLQDRVLKRQLAAPANMAILITQCSQAVAEMHRKGWLWGDGSLGNVLVKMRGSRIEEVRLCDLGATGRNIPGTVYPEKLLRTRTYASPNRCPGNPVRPQDDLFALGKVMWEVATGCRPTGDGESPDVNKIRDAAIRAMVAGLLCGVAPAQESAEALPRAQKRQGRKFLGLFLLPVLAVGGALLCLPRSHAPATAALGVPGKAAARPLRPEAFTATATPPPAPLILPPSQQSAPALVSPPPHPPTSAPVAPKIALRLTGASFRAIGNQPLRARHIPAGDHPITVELQGEGIRDVKIQCFDEAMTNSMIPGANRRRSPYRWHWSVYGPKFAITINYRIRGKSERTTICKTYEIL